MYIHRANSLVWGPMLAQLPTYLHDYAYKRTCLRIYLPTLIYLLSHLPTYCYFYNQIGPNATNIIEK